MIGINRQSMVMAVWLAAAFFASGHAGLARPGTWTDAVEVRHEDELCIAYRARLDGPFLVVRAELGPGWHSFAMDNKRRADEKLAGRQPLSIDRATEIAPAAGLAAVGPWYQSPPKDFSRPELLWFSWGFEREAVFAAKVRRSGSAAARITIRGQACTERFCKIIDVTLSLPDKSMRTDAGTPEIKLTNLVQVR